MARTPTINYVAVGLRIQALLDERRWNHTEFAIMCGISRVCLLQVLKGDQSGGRIDTLSRIAFTLGVTTDFLLHGHISPLKRPRTPKAIEVSLTRCRDLLEHEWSDDPEQAEDNPQEFARVVELLWNSRFNRPPDSGGRTPNISQSSVQQSIDGVESR